MSGLALAGGCVFFLMSMWGIAVWSVVSDLRREARYIRTELVSLRNLTRVLIEQRDDVIRSKKAAE